MVYVEKPVEKVNSNFGSACNRLHSDLLQYFELQIEQVVEKVVEKVVYVLNPADKVNRTWKRLGEK